MVGKPRLGLLLAAVVLLALGALGSAYWLSLRGPIGNQTSCVTVPSSSIYVDWAYLYGNLTEMRNAADRVVDGVVVGSSTSGCGIIVTHYTVRIIMTLKGDSDSFLVIVTETGGVIGSSKQEVREDPLIQVGDHVIMFLNLDPESGMYEILGGPQGRLIVTNHLVYSLNVLYPDRNIDIINWRISGLPETALWDQLR